MVEKLSPSSNELRVLRFNSIHEIDDVLWDSINPDKGLFHSHRFIRAVEDAQVENSRFWCLLFYKKDKLVATTVLSSFSVSLDLFLGDLLKKLVKMVRRWKPDFLRIGVLFCGLPISLGQHNLLISETSFIKDVLKLLNEEMSSISRSQQIRFMCIKEFRQPEIKRMDQLKNYGFFRANSLPYVTLKIRWSDFESYLSDLRHPYRRAILLSLRKLGNQNPVIDRYKPELETTNKPGLVLGNSQVCSPEEFFKLYNEVMNRAQVKLETLNEAFFKNLFTEMSDELEILAMIQGDEILGAAIIAYANKTMTFTLVGLKYEKRDEYEVYFNLVYGILSIAIERGCEELNLGQTSYWLKQRIGGECIPEYFYLKGENKLIHFILRTLNSWIFPQANLLNPNVFREGNRNAVEVNDQN